MTDPLRRLQRQIVLTRLQRAKVRVRAAQTVDRLAPQRLAYDAYEGVLALADDTQAQVRKHPGTAAAVILGGAIALFHRPIGRAVDRWLDRVEPPAEPPEHVIEDDFPDPT